MEISSGGRVLKFQIVTDGHSKHEQITFSCTRVFTEICKALYIKFTFMGIF